MELTRIEPFLSFYRSVRKRTRAIARCIPADRVEWKPGDGLFSPGDLVRHIAATERWMYVENAHGRKSTYPGHGTELAEGLDNVLVYLDALHEESLVLLGELTPEQIAGPCQTVAGAEVPVWLVLRIMLEHEIHHRGQLYTQLGIMGVERPSLFGLTEKQVFEASGPTEGSTGPATP